MCTKIQSCIWRISLQLHPLKGSQSFITTFKVRMSRNERAMSTLYKFIIFFAVVFHSYQPMHWKRRNIIHQQPLIILPYNSWCVPISYILSNSKHKLNQLKLADHVETHLEASLHSQNPFSVYPTIKAFEKIVNLTPSSCLKWQLKWEK